MCGVGLSVTTVFMTDTTFLQFVYMRFYAYKKHCEAAWITTMSEMEKIRSIQLLEW